MTSAGAQSQFKSLANIKQKIVNACEALDDYLLATSSSPDNEAHKAISPIKEMLQGAIVDAESRIDLIFKADSEPKYGWKAITAYKEKQNLDNKDPEKEKAFAACLKEVQDADKKSKTTPAYTKSF